MNLHNLVDYYERNVESYEKLVIEVDLYSIYVGYLNENNIKPSNLLEV